MMERPEVARGTMLVPSMRGERHKPVVGPSVHVSVVSELGDC